MTAAIATKRFVHRVLCPLCAMPWYESCGNCVPGGKWGTSIWLVIKVRNSCAAHDDVLCLSRSPWVRAKIGTLGARPGVWQISGNIG